MTTADSAGVASEAARKYLRWHLTHDVGPVRLRKLIEHFGSAEEAGAASVSQLEGVLGIGSKIAKAITAARHADLVEPELARVEACGLRVLCTEDPGYPVSLKRITDPPICLYVRGELQPNDAVAVAIVGTRRCSHYGREQAARFGELLGQAGFTVVSGLARGIDGESHRGALRVGGRTVAVLGNGLASVYPAEHEALAEQICASGAVVSEFPVDSAPEPGNFPRRNRIIIGLSLGVIVVEAGKRSGALITARLASEYNREVFAVPGRIDQPGLTQGVNALIRDGGAKLITCLQDVLDELGEVGAIFAREGDSKPVVASSEPEPPSEEMRSEEKSKASPGRLTDEEQAVFQAMREGAADIEDICLASALDAGSVMASLTKLELIGLVTRLPGNRFEVVTRHA